MRVTVSKIVLPLLEQPLYRPLKSGDLLVRYVGGRWMLDDGVCLAGDDPRRLYADVAVGLAAVGCLASGYLAPTWREGVRAVLEDLNDAIRSGGEAARGKMAGRLALVRHSHAPRVFGWRCPTYTVSALSFLSEKLAAAQIQACALVMKRDSLTREEIAAVTCDEIAASWPNRRGDFAQEILGDLGRDGRERDRLAEVADSVRAELSSLPPREGAAADVADGKGRDKDIVDPPAPTALPRRLTATERKLLAYMKAKPRGYAVAARYAALNPDYCRSLLAGMVRLDLLTNDRDGTGYAITGLGMRVEADKSM